MTTLAAPSTNQIQSTLAASFTRGTDTTIVLADGSLFPSPTPLGHVVYIHNADETKWCLVLYTSRAVNTLTMGGGATDYALAKCVTVGDEAYTWPIGSIVELVCAADEIAQLFAAMLNKDGTVALTADWDIGDGRKLLADIIRARDAAGLGLQDDDGNGVFVNDGGIIDIAKQSGVKVHLSGSQTIGTGSWTKIEFDTEDHDIQSEHNIGTYTTTVTKAGLYLIILAVHYPAGLDTKMYASRIVTSAGNASSIVNSGANGECFPASIGIFSLAATNTIYAQTYHDSGVDKSIQGSTTFLIIAKIA